ncbi:extracellular calcium-sensing receptor-like [Protopterus annectens]|uniref:extracellular calcium-sensing receptor-like n=1 Tax=Protopterus annectens TaxID=7888 RepID=UPI001CF9C90E|nr:extracellular calcium-sensing receptor-like [Protopterus annectens]
MIKHQSGVEVTHAVMVVPSSSLIMTNDDKPSAVIRDPKQQARAQCVAAQISHAAGNPRLSDKYQFPSFLRTMPSLHSLTLAIAEFIKHFGWTWVGIIYADNDFTIQGSEQLRAELLISHACVAFFEIIPVNPQKSRIISLVETIIASSAAAIMTFAYSPEVTLIMEELAARNKTEKAWLATIWVEDALFSQRNLWPILNGVIGFTQPAGSMPGFKEFLYNIHPLKYPDFIYIKQFWASVFNCSWANNLITENTSNEGGSAEFSFCTGKEKLETLEESIYPVNNFRNPYTMFNAVFSLAYALQNLQSCRHGEGPFCNKTCADRKHFEPWQLLHYLKSVRFRDKNAQEVYFDENGDSPALCDITNWQLISEDSLRYVKVGTYQKPDIGNSMFTVNQSAIMWNGGYTQTPRSDCSRSCTPGNRKAPIQGMPICCYDCVPCSDGEIANQTDATNCIKCPEDSWSNERKEICILKQVEFLSFEDSLGSVLTAFSIAFAIIPACILWIFIKYRDTPVVKANNCNLSYFLLIALIMCFLCSLIFIGKPNDISCLLRQSVFGVIFSVCISSILAKTITVFIAFSMRRPGGYQQNWLGTKAPVFIGLCCTTLQVMICTVWLVLLPPFQEKNMNLYKDKIIIACNEGSGMIFYCMLAYLGILASVCFIIAFLVRKLPDRYNEAKFITFSMLIFVSVWLTFVPANLSTKGKYVVVVEIFAILSSGFGLLSCIFFPKCYIIILRPELNTKESATRSSH